MKIVVPFKVVFDDQDIVAGADRSLDFSKAQRVVSMYDLNAIEAAAQLGAATGSPVVAISVGGGSIDDTKLKKNVLARGMDELRIIADDAADGLDSRATAAALAGIVAEIEDCGLIVCGDGSADLNAGQVGVQLADKLGIACVSGVVRAEIVDGAVEVDRVLESAIETLRVPLPALIAVDPEIASPHIPGMKDILSAGKKPASASAASGLEEAAVEVVEERAPEQVVRKQEIFDAAADGDMDKFVAAVKASL